MSQQIALIAIKALLDENKQPTLALVKGKLTTRLPMPTVIAALNAYKKDPSIVENLVAEAPPVKEAPKAIEQRVMELESQVQLLLQRIEQLEAKN
ncbi:hypothetical protein OAG1_26810 [Agarivorans sp. OAG1]|uniref:KfrA N-terminal DNA-binding domain-containing protein n=1 Tax=Agarivorans albus MKT 106 TaxID=1331007 RepID=R9PSX5_AGAAL|nr:hypothetical protein [Agarivorans albus]BEU03881.1 hypothetical protein OAG1_26810 [Agarivorans sp. OAG1]GAD01431.1 hypothetical protein AALB_1511 [Agarivorans albus MKT 106]